VRRNPPRMPGAVVGVATERDLIVLDADAPPDDVLALLDERGIGGKQLHIFSGRTNVVISRENLHDEGLFRDALHARLGVQARLVDGLGAVSVIGTGINATYANVAAGAATLAGIGVSPVGTATSSFRITWLIDRERLADAARALHARFIDSQHPLVP